MLFKQVVDLIGFELHLDGGIAVDLAGMLEKADAGVKQHHSLKRQIGVLRFIGRGLCGRDQENRGKRRRKGVGNDMFQHGKLLGKKGDVFGYCVGIFAQTS